MYVDQLRKRSEVLGVEKSTLGESATRDAVLSGKVAIAVFKSAVQALSPSLTEEGSSPSAAIDLSLASFVTSLLAVASEFQFAAEVRKEIKR